MRRFTLLCLSAFLGALSIDAATLSLPVGSRLKIEFSGDPLAQPCPGGPCNVLTVYAASLTGSVAGQLFGVSLYEGGSFVSSTQGPANLLTFYAPDSTLRVGELSNLSRFQRPFRATIYVTANVALSIDGTNTIVTLGHSSAFGYFPSNGLVRPTVTSLTVLGPDTTGPRYRLTDIGILPGAEYMHGQDINASGWAVGFAVFPSPYPNTFSPHGFLWNGTGLIDLGAETIANGINDSGQSVGHFTEYYSSHPAGLTGAQFAMQWSSTGAGTRLYQGVASDINNAGLVLGTGVNGPMAGAARLALELEHAPRFINSQGNTAGIWRNQHAFFYNPARTSAQFVSPLPPSAHSGASGLNDYDQVVGWSGLKGFFWSNSNTVDLYAAIGAKSATGINNEGHVVGTDDHGGYLWNGATKYNVTSQLTNAPGWHVFGVAAISNTGYLLASASNSGNLNQIRTVILSPVCLAANGAETPGCAPARGSLVPAPVCVPTTGPNRGGVPCGSATTPNPSTPPSTPAQPSNPTGCVANTGPSRGGVPCDPNASPSEPPAVPPPATPAPDPTPACIPGTGVDRGGVSRCSTPPTSPNEPSPQPEPAPPTAPPPAGCVPAGVPNRAGLPAC